MKKSGFPFKTKDRKSKSGWELRLKTQIKNRLRRQARILKRIIKKYSDETEKAQQLELKKAWRDQPKNPSERRRKTKKIPRQDQTIETKQDVPKQRKNFTNN